MSDPNPNPEPRPPAPPRPDSPARDRKTTPQEWGLFALMIGGGCVVLGVGGFLFFSNLAVQLENVEARSQSWDEPYPEVDAAPPPVALPQPSSPDVQPVNGRCDVLALTPSQLDVLSNAVQSNAVADPAAPPVAQDPNWSRRPNAEYPEEASRRGIGRGRVVLDCLTDAQGEVMACTITEEDPPGADFARAALEGMCDARFNPLIIDGSPRPSRVRYTMRFELRG